MSDNDLPDFTGKVLIIYDSNDASAGITLEYAEFKTFNDRLFLVGRTPQSVEAWMRNLSAGVAWDSVIHYLVFNSREDFDTRMREVRPGLLRRVFIRITG